MDTPTKTGKLRLKKRWLIGLALLLLLGVAYSLLPALLEKIARDQLIQLGAEQVVFGDIQLNLFTGELVLTDLNIQGPQGEKLTLGQAALGWQWSPLWRKQLVIERLALRDGVIPLHQFAEGMAVTGLVPPAGEASEVEELQAEPDPPAEPWGLSLGQLTLENVHLQLTTPDFDTAIALQRLQLQQLTSWQPDQPTPLALELTVDGAPLQLQGELLPFSTNPEFTGTVSLQELVLDPFLPSELGLQSRLSVDLNTRLRHDPEQGSTLRLDGQLQLSQLDYGSPEAKLTAANLEWNGELAVTYPSLLDQPLATQQGELLIRDYQLALPEQKFQLRGGLLHSRSRLAYYGEGEASGVLLEEFALLKPSELDLQDNNVQPPYRAQFREIDLQLSGLDTRNPQQPLQAKLESRLNEYSKLSLNAEGTPLAQPPALTLNGKISALELPPLSGYSVATMGYQLQQGTMDGKVAATLKDDKLDATIDLLLKRLKLITKDEEEARAFSERLAMPLDKSLDLLRDDKDHIALQIKLSGPLDELAVDASQVVNKALANGLKYAAISYAKHLIQPWGLLITASELIGKATALRFDPIMFQPASQEIDENYLPYLDKMATLLQERPQLSLSLCGVASVMDRQLLAEAAGLDLQALTPEQQQQLKEQWQALARDRAEQVKQYLVSEGKIDPPRLFICLPALAKDEQEEARVEVLL